MLSAQYTEVDSVIKVNCCVLCLIGERIAYIVVFYSVLSVVAVNLKHLAPCRLRDVNLWDILISPEIHPDTQLQGFTCMTLINQPVCLSFQCSSK